MPFKVPSKRRRAPSSSTSRSCNNGERSSVARSSPFMRAQNRKPRPQPAFKRLSLPTSSQRAASATPSSHLGSQPPDLQAGITGQRDAGISPEQDVDINEREEDDSMNEVIMAVDLRDRGTVGCAYYVAREEKLYMMEDVRMGGVEIIQTLILHGQPTVLLLSTRIDEDVSTLLEHAARGEDTETGYTESFTNPYLLEVRPSPEFGYEAGKFKLGNLRFDGDTASQVAFITPSDAESYQEYVSSNEPGYTGIQGKLLRLSSRIDLESRMTVGCAGAVLTYLQRKKAVVYLPGDQEANLAFRVSAVEMFSLSGVMFIDANTLDALQIMQSQSHPVSHNQGPSRASAGSKEGLSVYGLFHHLARTPQGKFALRQYFLRPSFDLDIINERLDTTSVFIRPDNTVVLNGIVKSLGQIKNMKTVVVHLRKGISNGVGKGTSGIKSGVWSSLRSHRTVVKPGVDEELDQMKNTYDGIEDLLNRTSQSIAETIPAQYSLELNVIFFPQIGFLISIPSDPVTGRGNYEGEDTDGGAWDRIFSTRSRVYYKDYRMRELDETLGDMYAVICDKEIEIVHKLGQEVLKFEDFLTKASEICGELDRYSLLALTQGAGMYKLSRPYMTEDNIIHIKGGRQLTVPSYVSNDTFLVGGTGLNDRRAVDNNPEFSSETQDQPSMLMMTGPNYSGKSVHLKQVALIVYMAHIGCFVPADAATIGLTDKILTRIATKETITKTQSAFMIDLQQVAKAINLATHRSLILIDEFGKGTDSNDGAGLACGLFEHFLSLGAARPKVLGATHFHEIFENGFLQARPYLSFGHMEVRIDMDAEAVEEQITYLYK
ncbi:MAG: hypothetical protein Q9183_000284 [Haloplaca sp. 2 TL-2023]